MKRAALAVVVLAAIAGGAYWYEAGPCGRRTVAAGLAGMDRLQGRFEDGVRVFQSTPVMFSGEPIKNLYDIKRQAAEAAVSPCLGATQKQLVAWMAEVIGTAEEMIQAQTRGLPPPSEETQQMKRDTMAGMLEDYRKAGAWATSCAPMCR